MADLHKTIIPPHKEQIDARDGAFVAFVIIITAIAATATLIQIYMQNPR
jgi:hypothetical protein